MMITTTTTTSSSSKTVVSFSSFFVIWFVCYSCFQNVPVVTSANIMMTKKNKKNKAELLKTKIANYKAGKAVIINIHLTHQAGTFLRWQADKNGIPYDPYISNIHGENRTELLQQLLPTWIPPTSPEGDLDEIVPGKAIRRFFKPPYAHDSTHPFLINYYKKHPNNPNNKDDDEIYETNWDLFYDKHNISYFNWWESSGNTFRWSYHPFPDYNDPFISHIDWESPHVIAIIIMRDPMDRLLACTPKCLVGKHHKMDEATADDWWELANFDKDTDNFQLRSLTTPYYDISPHGVQSAKSLLERMDYIFDQDCLNPSLLQFSNDVGWSYIENLHEPPEKVKSDHATARERINNDTLYDFLQEKNKLDIELYEWSKSKSSVVCSALDNNNNIFVVKGDLYDENFYYYASYVLAFGIGFICHYIYVHYCGRNNNNNNLNNNKSSATKGGAAVYSDDDDDDELQPLTMDEFNDEDQ